MNNVKSSLRMAFASGAASAVVLAAAAALGFAQVNLIAILVSAVIIAALTTVLMSFLRDTEAPAPSAVEASPAPQPDVSTTDPLTRTINRRGVDIAIMEAMALGERYGNPLCVTKIDLDKLKQINEKHGQAAGDHILAGVAAVLTEALRMPDKVGRYDADEFIVVMPQTERTDAELIAKRLCDLIAKQEFDVDGGHASVTASVGVTQYHQGEDIESLLTRVQRGVDASRDAGRNRATAV